MDSFVNLDPQAAQQREAEHGGEGPIAFHRMMGASQFASSLDFVDYTVIPAGSSIGRHLHAGNEEFYFVVSGAPLININGRESRSPPGTLAMVRSGEWHSLSNDTSTDVTILVVQARVDGFHER